MNQVGFMQGRLSPPREGYIQAFPLETWRDEFPNAGEAGLDCVEWIYELPTATVNPIRTAAGRSEMRKLSEASHIAIWSVCADYFMADLLLEPDGRPRLEPAAELDRLLVWAAELGCRYVLLPFVDASRLWPAQEAALPDALAPYLESSRRLGIELHLETDLPPARLAHLAARTGHPSLGINLDTGNSAALGYDPATEIAQIGSWLRSVHVKDRLRGGSSVPLGRGDADLDSYFRLLQELPYEGAYILQVARGEPGAEVQWCASSRDLVQSLLARGFRTAK
jgi:L-ribulose-5-phosphate 3-epimerase